MNTWPLVRSIAVFVAVQARRFRRPGGRGPGRWLAGPAGRPRSHVVVAACLAALFLLAGAAAASTTPDELRFDVRLDDAPIGSQVFRIQQGGDQTRVSIEASFDVKFLFVTAYTYRYRNEEVWKGDCLASMDSTTDDNGEPFRVRGTSEGEAFVVDAGKGRDTLPACTASFAYWRPDRLAAGRLLNSQTGEYEAVQLRELGVAKVAFRGRDVDARHVVLEGPRIRIELWYAVDGGDWLALESTTSSGRRLKYLRQ